MGESDSVFRLCNPPSCHKLNRLTRPWQDVFRNIRSAGGCAFYLVSNRSVAVCDRSPRTGRVGGNGARGGSRAIWAGIRRRVDPRRLGPAPPSARRVGPVEERGRRTPQRWRHRRRGGRGPRCAHLGLARGCSPSNPRPTPATGRTGGSGGAVAPRRPPTDFAGPNGVAADRFSYPYPRPGAGVAATGTIGCRFAVAGRGR